MLSAPTQSPQHMQQSGTVRQSVTPALSWREWGGVGTGKAQGPSPAVSLVQTASFGFSDRLSESKKLRD